MKEIVLKKLLLSNFKGCTQREIDFTSNTTISGQNASGKTTILDAFTWLLFNKDSGDNEKFAIRPLDSNGNLVDNVEISVTAVINVEGMDYEVKKIQKQNWVKKRGTEEAKLQGNVNSYEIDGYPRKDTEFKAFISEIIGEDIFKMITSPAYFTSLPWKEQRATLMQFVSDMSDIDIATGKDEFSLLLPELQKAPSTDDIQKKYAGQKKDLAATLKELPIRIDEIEKQKVDYDFAELELLKADIEGRIEVIQGASNSNVKALEGEYKQLCDEEAEYKRHKVTELNALRNSKEAEISRFNCDLVNKQRELSGVKLKIEECEIRISSFEKVRKKLSLEYKETKKTTFNKVSFDKSAETCPVCKRKLPDDEIKTLHDTFDKEQDKAAKAFEKEKADELKRLNDEGEKLGNGITKLKSDIESYKNDLKVLNKDFKEANDHLNVLKTEFDAIPVKYDFCGDVKYLTLCDKLEALKGKITDAKNTPTNDGEVSNLNAELEEVNRKLSAASQNVAIDERIALLQAEQRETAQKMANVEKILYTLEQFVKYKMDRVSGEINSHFSGIKWNLFDVQINGGIRETCECTYNGVKYSDLNSGHRIVAGLEIIKALQALYEVYAPVWVDNAESLNDFNMPEIGSQVIRLCVTEDKKLVISK